MCLVALMRWQGVRDWCTVPRHRGSGCPFTLRLYGRKKVCYGVRSGWQRLGVLPHFHRGLYGPDKAATRPYLGVTMGREGQPSADHAGVTIIATLYVN
jgi:hypothetical protein